MLRVNAVKYAVASVIAEGCRYDPSGMITPADYLGQAIAVDVPGGTGGWQGYTRVEIEATQEIVDLATAQLAAVQQ